LVRKRQKFREERESPRLKRIGIFAITVVTVICFVLFLYSTGVIQTYLGSQSATNPSYPAVNTFSTAIPASTLFSDYSEYPTIAAVNYTQQWVYVLSNVSSVQDRSGNYQSCTDPSESYLYGCSYTADMSGWIVWTWNSTSDASKVPVDIDFVAECYVIGMSVGDLYLNSCFVTQS
jgi:hypothetical protein